METDQRCACLTDTDPRNDLNSPQIRLDSFAQIRKIQKHSILPYAPIAYKNGSNKSSKLFNFIAMRIHLTEYDCWT